MNKGEIYDLKSTIAEFILPRLILFKEGVDKTRHPSTPDFRKDSLFAESVYPGYEDAYPSYDIVNQFWSERLGEMIFTFTYYFSPDKIDSNLEHSEIDRLVKKGFDSFVRYYDKLWV